MPASSDEPDPLEAELRELRAWVVERVLSRRGLVLTKEGTDSLREGGGFERWRLTEVPAPYLRARTKTGRAIALLANLSGWRTLRKLLPISRSGGAPR